MDIQVGIEEPKLRPVSRIVPGKVYYLLLDSIDSIVGGHPKEIEPSCVRICVRQADHTKPPVLVDSKGEICEIARNSEGEVQEDSYLALEHKLIVDFAW